MNRIVRGYWPANAGNYRFVKWTILPHTSVAAYSRKTEGRQLFFLEISGNEKQLQSLIDTLKHYNDKDKTKETAQNTRKGYQTLRNKCSRTYKWLNVDNMADAYQIARLLRYI